MGWVILGSPWRSHGQERFGGSPMVTQLPKAPGLMLEPSCSDCGVQSNIPFFPASKCWLWPPSSLQTRWWCFPYLHQGVVLIPRINGPQLMPKAVAWEVHALSSSPRRFPDLGKNKPLNTNLIFQKNWMGISITTVHPCFDRLRAVPSIQISIKLKNQTIDHWSYSAKWKLSECASGQEQGGTWEVLLMTLCSEISNRQSVALTGCTGMVCWTGLVFSKHVTSVPIRLKEKVK